MAEKLTARKRQAMEMRRHIQTTALALFDEKGFENVSMQDVAQAAGCSIGNIYHYFRSKDELAIQVTTHVDAAYADWAREHPARPGHARQRLLDFVGDSLSISSREEVLYTSFVHGLKYPEQGILDYREDREWFRLLGELIGDCRAEGAIGAPLSDADLLRELVVLHRGILFQWRIEEEGFDLAGVGRAMAAQLLAGLEK